MAESPARHVPSRGVPTTVCYMSHCKSHATHMVGGVGGPPLAGRTCVHTSVARPCAALRAYVFVNPSGQRPYKGNSGAKFSPAI